jgi:hypothetical protein
MEVVQQKNLREKKIERMKKEKNTYNQIFGYEKWPFCVNYTIWRWTEQKEVEEGEEEKNLIPTA